MAGRGDVPRAGQAANSPATANGVGFGCDDICIGGQRGGTKCNATVERALPPSLAASIAFALTGADAWPQSGRTIKVILPFAPGGPAYNAIRILGQQIGATGGPTIVVEPHPGAGTAIGTELVATAAPDGNTLGIISNSFVLLPQTRKLNYDPLTDFAPICDLVDFPPLIVVNSESPYHTLADLIAPPARSPAC